MNSPSAALILIAAAEFEVKPTWKALRDRGIEASIELCGIGALNAAKRAASLAKAASGRDVIFVGTAGSFGDFLTPTLVKSEYIQWLPACERAGLSYSIPRLAPPIQLQAAPPWLATLPARRVLCAPNISLEPALPVDMNPAVFVENLELYSCASEVATAARTFAVLLGITNGIGKSAHAQWLANHPIAARLSAEFIAEHYQ